MSDVEWTRVEGMVIAPGLDPMKLAEQLKEKGVVAQLEWYQKSPELVGLRIGTDGNKVATLSVRGRILRPGPTLQNLAKDLAQQFKAEVMIGGIDIDATEEVPSQLIAQAAADEELAPIRTVEVGTTPASAVPLMAAFEGVDIAELDLPDEKRLLAAVIPGQRGGWYFGDTPVVILNMDGGDFQAFFVAEDDPESVVTYNWGMDEVVIAGAQGWEGETPEMVAELVGAGSDIQSIHDAVPGVDDQLAFEATKSRGPQAVRKFVAALGLPSDIADFLLGSRGIEQIDGATVHYARGISNAIGRSVDILIDERQEGSRFWDTYTDVVTTRNWLVPAVTALEASAGAALLILGRKKGGTRSVAGRIGTFVGSLMIFDSVAQNLLAKYMERKEHRRSQHQNVLRS